jgi:hypothetical protein
MTYKGDSKAFGTGWSQFAGIFLFIVGIFNIMDGAVGLARPSYFDASGLVYQNVKAWAVAFLIIGIIQVLIGWLVVSHKPAGRWLGVVFAGLSMLVSFFAMGHYVAWAIMQIVIDGVIIYGLTARWEEA